MTEAEVGAIRAAIYYLQEERDVLSDEKQARDLDLLLFRQNTQLYGPVPESGPSKDPWEDHLRTMHNYAAAVKYDALKQAHERVAARYNRNIDQARALEALIPFSPPQP